MLHLLPEVNDSDSTLFCQTLLVSVPCFQRKLRYVASCTFFRNLVVLFARFSLTLLPHLKGGGVLFSRKHEELGLEADLVSRLFDIKLCLSADHRPETTSRLIKKITFYASRTDCHSLAKPLKQLFIQNGVLKIIILQL